MSATEAPTSAPESLRGRGNVRVLVVDDDSVDVMRVERLLRQIRDLDLTIATAVDCASGLDLLANGAFDLVLLDYRLPDGTALDVLRGAEVSRGDGPAVIVQTVHDSEDTAVETLALGAQDYLVKGRFDAAELRRAIRYALERNDLVKERRRLTERLEAALQHIETLEGLLSICAHCKSIRDEHGEWKAPEVYLSARTHAQFSHGLCPGCLEKHYAYLLEPGESWPDP